VAHGIFRRFEPSALTFLGLVLAAQVPLFLWLHSAFTLVREAAVALSLIDCIFLAALGLSRACYRLFFHPLHNYPGPVLARLTKFWLASFCRDGDTFRVVRELHKRYGDVVRIG
jgi:hypothetical protein